MNGDFGRGGVVVKALRHRAQSLQRCAQGSGGETWGKETIRKTQT
jgi:hypothetical protein